MLQVMCEFWVRQDEFALLQGIDGLEARSANRYCLLCRIRGWTEMVLSSYPNTVSDIRRSDSSKSIPMLVLQQIQEKTVSHLTIDPRDKIFSIYGLISKWANSDAQVPFRPDYRQTAAQVFIDITNLLVKHVEVLSFLSLIGDQSKHKVKELPS
jgi:hypothetical protein